MSADNIVKASFVFGKTATTRSLRQWDYGQVLQFEGIDLPAAYTVHFSNQPTNGNAKTQVGGPDGVAILDEYLTTGLPVHAWVFLHAGADDGETVYSVTIPVTKRPKPTEDEPTPVQQGVIDTAIAALNEGVQEVHEAVEGVQDAIEAALDRRLWSRVSALEGCAIVETGPLIETVGKPPYVGDPTTYAPYGITDTGWYVFARIAAPTGVTVSAETAVTGAAGFIAEAGAAYIDVAVRFGVTAQSQLVTVNWGGASETWVFKASDLAIENMDYRVTFYIYPLEEFAIWSYALTTDATFVANKQYYTKDENDVYTLAEVTAGAAVTANTYYNHTKLHLEGMTRNVTYKLDTIVDCPVEIALPTVEDDGYGAWFEMQMRYSGSFSCTLLPPEGVKIGTAQTQSQTAGINTVDLQYTEVGGVKMWTLLNTHANIPA